ncbi:MAG: RNA polymerase sigma factor [Leadbetterella sp.]
MEKVLVNESELLSAYIQGDESAFATLVNRYSSKIYTTIYLVVRDKEIAEDLVQDTFIKAIRTLKEGRYNEEGKFLPWILRIAHNLAIDYFRRAKRYPSVVFEDGSNVFNSLNFADDSIESLQITKESHEHLRSMIKQLPPQQREVLILRHYEDLSFQEIAETTGVSINTALGRMRYALINLRKLMSKNKYAYDTNLYPE